MDKNVYEILNNAEANLNEYNVEELSDIEKANIKKKFKASIKKNKKNKFKAAVAIVLITTALLGVTFNDSVSATINMISLDISTKLGINKNLDDYKTTVNSAITNNGITIKLNEVILDGNTLIVSSTIKSEEAINETGATPSGNIKIDGKSVCKSASGSSKKIDNYTTEEIMEYSLKEANTNKDLNIEIIYKDVLLNGKTLKGNWKFAFKTSGAELAAKTKTIKLNEKIKLENGVELTLNKYTTNDIGQKIFFNKTHIKNEKIYSVVLKGTDNLGNKVEFGLREQERDKGVFVIEKLFSNLSEKATEITLTPYSVKVPEKSGKMSNDYVKTGDAFKINLAK